MDTQPIVDRIDKDARAAADAILADAEHNAAAARDESDQKIKKAFEDVRTQAKQEAAALKDRMRRMALLDSKKQDLAAKRALLGEAFVQAFQRMTAMPESAARAFGLSILLHSATGDEVICPDSTSAWCDDAFVSEANRALQAAHKPGNLTLSDERHEIGGGFLLRRGGMEINCSYQAAIEAARLELEAEVAALLFM
jgi:V/A-type H+-transporting ATPase subunit E